MAFVEGALDVVSKVGPSIFPLGRVVKVVRYGSKSNSITVAVNITLTVIIKLKLIIECCSPPPVRLAATCVAFGGSLVSTIVSPNPVSLGATVHFLGEIYDKC